jgi:hypothetical protein
VRFDPHQHAANEAAACPQLLTADSQSLLMLLLLLLLLLLACRKLDIQRQVSIEPAAVGLRGTIPASWAALTELNTL